MTGGSVRIDIITPVYNGAEFLPACLRCVADQAADGVRHVLVVEASSTDATVDLAHEAVERFAHVGCMVVSKRERQGPYHALNQAISASDADVIGILNVDDAYEPGTLRRVKDVFAGVESPGLVVANCRVEDGGGRQIYINRPSRLRLADLLLGFAVCPHPVNPSAYFYHRRLHERIGMYEGHPAADLEFILRAVQAAHVVHVDEVWGRYRFRSGTITHDDAASGVGAERYQEILERYQAALMPWERALLPCRLVWHHHAVAAWREAAGTGPLGSKAGRVWRRVSDYRPFYQRHLSGEGAGRRSWD